MTREKKKRFWNKRFDTLEIFETRFFLSSVKFLYLFYDSIALLISDCNIFEIISKNNVLLPMSSSTIMETISGSDFNICEDEQFIPESNDYPDLHLETLTTCESQCWNSKEKCGLKDIIILTGKKYLTNLSQYTKKSVLLQLKDDHFVRSLIASIALFTIGMKLTRELDAWNVPSMIY